LANKPVALEVSTSIVRRWWNPYWSLYDRIRALPLQGKRVLFPGCGFGEDCLRLAERGAEVHGIDLSPDIVAIANERARNCSSAPIRITAMPCENISYPDGYFDTVLLVNILHHIDIERSMAEVMRVAKPGGVVLGLEMYTHSGAQWLRESHLFSKVIYPRVARRIYNGTPYITPDERKLNERELDHVVSKLERCSLAYYCIVADRVFSLNNGVMTRLDRILARGLGGLGRFLAGRVIFSGRRPMDSSAST
jgi:ubiquinone/menaquinone biosynthesis C-methylase UbiE